MIIKIKKKAFFVKIFFYFFTLLIRSRLLCKEIHAQFIEKYGSCIKRIIQYFQDANLPIPEFKNISEGFQVTVFTDRYDRVTENFTENLKLTKNQIEIIKNIKLNKYITTSELASIVFISERKIKANIAKLKARGIIKRIGPDNGGYWVVVRYEV